MNIHICMITLLSLLVVFFNKSNNRLIIGQKSESNV